MPVTRSTGKGRGASATASATEISGSEATATTTETTETSATGTTSTGTTPTGTTSTGTTSTGTTSTGTTATGTTATGTTATGTTATTTATAQVGDKSPTEGATTAKEGSASRREERLLPPPPPRAGVKEGAKQKRAASSKGAGSTKANRILKAKQELLRLQVELAAARLAALEAGDSEQDSEDEASVCSDTGAEARVDTWLDNQVPPPLLAITEHPHHPPTAPTPPRLTTETDRKQEPEAQCRSQGPQSTPAGGSTHSDFVQLAEAITLAIKAGQRPKIIELPTFSGSHQEWLPFRAAYYETENMFSSIENINRLRKNLKGKAREAVNSLLITTSHPSDIMKTLETRFGRPESIAMAEMDTLRALPRLNESPRDVCIFSTRVTNAVSTLRTLDCVYYLYNPEVARTMVEKLTSTQRYRYYDFAATQPKEEPDLLKFEKFLKREAELCGPYAQPEQINPHIQNTVNTGNQKRPQRVHTATEDKKSATPKCPVCENTGHTATDCEQFKSADNNVRWDLAKARRLCFRCLRYRNKTHTCRQKACGVNSCKYFHHSMLHYVKKTEKEDSESKEETVENINSAWTTTMKNQSYLKIMPVQVVGPAGTVNTFALLDDGSTVTLIDDSIASRVGAQGPIDPLHIEAINELRTTEASSRKVTFTLRGPNKREEQIQARTVKNLLVSPQRISREQLLECKHLRDMSNILSYENAKPGILIGQDNWHLLLASKTKKGNRSQPVASLTPLGWVLHGSYTRTLGRNVHHVNYVTDSATEDNLQEMMKQYFNMDALCITPKKPKTDPEEQALRILEARTVLTEEKRYETALLWKKEDITLPDNYDSSFRRLLGIEKKLDRDPQLKKKYTEQMEALITKGYAEPAPTEKTENRTWYLPHFAVINPMKPDKLRVVHDAAAKTRGVALNDLLLKGPDLLQSLPGVIMRFREHSIAITGDIKEMFMQVKLRNQDRDALRYLWRGDRRDNKPPEEYRMTSLIFGASSSPSTAIFVKNLNAKAHEATHPEAAAAIIGKHYVDDYLDSFKSLEDATRIVTDVREVHQAAGFELKQWKSNSASLLKAIGEEEQKEEIELYKTEEKSERVLGLMWKTKTDELTFNLSLVRIPEELVFGKTPTKREALRIVMSLFDPLGFASPVTIRAKQILQEVWRRGTTWDDEIDSDLAQQWQDWTSHLKKLRDVTIPRRYLHYSDATSLQLHIFTDASESSYAAVLYWRTVTPNGEINVSLTLAKAKVTPLKLTSIPRLELQAAVMGTRLAEAVTEEHERKPDAKIFWTDSKTVLAWIRTGSRTYKPYVAHRLAAIEEASAVNDWRWIPTKQNVADDATRDVPADFGRDHRWYRGPDFLYEHEESWPIEQSTLPPTEPTGEERVNLISTSNKQKISNVVPDVSRFSNWNRLRYTMARVLLFIQLCQTVKHSINYRRTKKNKQSDADWRRVNKPLQKKPTPKKPHDEENKHVTVSAELLKTAEELLMRSTQEDSFTQELEDIKKKKPINKDSRLRQLSFEYRKGILWLRSRINAAEDIEEGVRSPIILDGNHPIVKLWVQHIHSSMHHAGVEATINECLQQYWVLRIRPVTKTIVKRCLRCRMRTQVPPHPRTGDLPSCRLAHHKRAFTYTGVDYFGPLTVTVGRTKQKRYVAIFTCLTTRAIHLELVASLTTDSAIMALRRMITRRGCPTQIWSDNGTNLKGADKELRRAIDGATAEEAAKKTISWRFIPPGAPFMGGAWERMVRSVKTALSSTLHERHPTEEVLVTLLAEAEYTVNSRPLTHVSVDANDPEALTPNHFLLGGPGRAPTPGNFDEKDTLTKSNWRASQRLADMFWTRWLREYLPGLQNRREPNGTGREVKVGDLVQIADTNLPRNLWLRGLVTATYPGPDAIVRTVDVKTKGGVLRRPVRKLLILPIEDVARDQDKLR